MYMRNKKQREWEEPEPQYLSGLKGFNLSKCIMNQVNYFKGFKFWKIGFKTFFLKVPFRLKQPFEKLEEREIVYKNKKGKTIGFQYTLTEEELNLFLKKSKEKEEVV